jgi:acyl dehydratase
VGTAKRSQGVLTRKIFPQVTAKMNDLPKVVVSRTLDKVEWANSRLVGDDVTGELTRLKQEPGRTSPSSVAPT